MFEKVMVALDWSEQSDRVLEAAEALARRDDGEVRVLHVHEVERIVPHGSGPLAVKVGAAASEEQQQALERVLMAAKRFSDAGVRASGEVRVSLPGRVAAEIVDESQAWGAGVVVIGSRGLTNLAGIILGSTTHKVLNLTELPVLVVR